MTRIFLKLAVSFVTFSIGVGVTAIYWIYRLPDATLPQITPIVQRYSCFPGLSVKVAKSTSQTEYFPVALSENARSAEFVNEWYSGQLKAMNELPLSALENEDESYRFLWLRTFHQPISIHVWRKGDRHFITVKRLNGQGGYEPGTFDLYWARSLSENEWDGFMMHLEHSEYWLMPTQNDRMLLDGAQWIMEAYRDGRYHVVDRQSPEPSAYRDACMYLLRKSALLAEIPANEVY
ncbi:MAG TPA: hypothetical protein VJR02_05455 [Pyrinomonadaceae bacterium]|nr:hypothetical protein [Pyrinomonadaceae bacterium]